jgi:hypothetical protein
MRATAVALALALVVSGCATEAIEPSASPGTAPPSASPTPADSLPPSPTPTIVVSPPAPPSASPPPTVLPTSPPSPSPEPTPGDFAINLYREGVFVSEYTRYYCLPAAMQVMINIMSDGPPDTSRETQDNLYALADELDGYEFPERVRDVEPEGWARGLRRLGYGRFRVVARPTIEEAISLAARQLRLTGRPVGLLTWRGAHSWVMSGFEADADPLLTDHYAVTGVWILDVWWPRISERWGESDPPNTLVPVERLPLDYKPYRRPYGEFPDKDGQYVLVIPIADD